MSRQAPTSIHPAAPRCRSGTGPRAWLQLTLAEVRSVTRDTAGLVVPFGLPLLLFLMSGLQDDGRPVAELGGLPALDVIALPLTLAMVLSIIASVNLPSFLATYRRSGVLRRLAVTPAHPAMVLTAQLLTSVAQTLVGIGLVLAVAHLAFDVSAPADPLAAAGVLALGGAAAYALGLLVAALAPTANSAVAVGFVVFFGTGALGGMFGSPDALPGALAEVGELLPFGATVQALGATWAGQAPEASHLVSLAATALVASVLAARFFRWD